MKAYQITVVEVEVKVDERGYYNKKTVTTIYDQTLPDLDLRAVIAVVNNITAPMPKITADQMADIILKAYPNETN